MIELAKAVADLGRETDEMSRAVKELEDRSAPGEPAGEGAAEKAVGPGPVPGS